MALTSFIHQFHFLRPWWFLALPLLIYLLMLLKRRKSSAAVWKHLCDADLLPHILTGQQRQQKSWPYWLMLLPLLISVIALAGPVWRKLPQPVYRPQSALVIILDLSASMRAGDIPPNRLERAKHKIIDILRRRVEGQTALVVFALEAFTVSPLTEDNNTIALMVPSLSDQLMPSQGSRPEMAIERARELLSQAASQQGDILLITDSADVASMRQALENLTDRGYRLSVMGIGSEEGAPIALQNGGFLKDRTGSIVVPKLDEDTLRGVAQLGNGIYHKFSNDDADINQFFALWNAAAHHESVDNPTSKKDFKADIWAEEGAWLILPLLPFVLLLFRRGWLVVLLMLILPVAQPVSASDLSRYFKNDNQNGRSAYNDQEYQQAAKTFSDARWKSAAYYKAGEYQKALDQLRGFDDSESIYNRGNILAKMGKLQDAMTAYDEALKRDPENEDAKYNRDLIDQYLKQQKQNQQKDSQKNGEDSRQNQKASKDGEQDQSGEQNQSDADKRDQSQADADKNQDQQNDSSQQAQQDQPGGEEKSGQSNATDENNDQQKDEPSKAQTADQSDKQNEKQNAEQSLQDANNDKEKDRQREQMQQTLQQQQPNNQQHDQSSPDERQASAVAQQNLSEEERRQMRLLEQWLRRVPDDPGGLLRRKFRYQSQARGGQVKGVKPW